GGRCRACRRGRAPDPAARVGSRGGDAAARRQASDAGGDRSTTGERRSRTGHRSRLALCRPWRRERHGRFSRRRRRSPDHGAGARILIVGTDVDFFAALREALGRGGLSVSMAWDAHQVDDLLDMVRPDIALIDLALGSRDVRPIVAKLASLEPVPTVAFVLGTDPAAPHFRAAMTYPIVATRAKPLDQLLAKVSEAKGPIDGRR